MKKYRNLITLGLVVISAFTVLAFTYGPQFDIEATLPNAYNRMIRAADDTSNPFSVRYTGSETSATITLNADTLTLIDDNTTTVIDLSAAANDTVGELVAVIEAITDYEAVMKAALSTDATGTNRLLAVTTQDLINNNVDNFPAGYDVLSDTSAVKYISAVITNNNFLMSAGTGKTLDKGFQNRLMGMVANVNFGTTGNIKIYVNDDLKWNVPLVDTVVTSFNFANPIETYKAREDSDGLVIAERIVVRADGSAWTAGRLHIYGDTVRIDASGKSGVFKY